MAATNLPDSDEARPEDRRRSPRDEVDEPSSLVARFGADEPLELDSGARLVDWQIAYQTYGELDRNRANAILVCHALTGDQHVANLHPVTGKPGWWSLMVGPGKPIDTDRYFVICANVVGGCMGTTGPASHQPGDRQGLRSRPAGDHRARHGARPGDAARPPRHHDAVLRHRRLARRHAGAAMGGELSRARLLGAADRHRRPPLLAEHRLPRGRPPGGDGRPDWRGGRYIEAGVSPRKGLAVARMAAHITYLSDEALHRKFGRNLQDRDRLTFGFDADFQIESYLRHQGVTFVERFDANSYLYMTRAMDYFDLAADHGGRLANAFLGTKTRFCVASFTSDWLFPTIENKAVVRALNAAGASVSFVEIETDRGHDSFLLDEPELFATIRGFLSSAAEARGLAR